MSVADFEDALSTHSGVRSTELAALLKMAAEAHNASSTDLIESGKSAAPPLLPYSASRSHSRAGRVTHSIVSARRRRGHDGVTRSDATTSTNYACVQAPASPRVRVIPHRGFLPGISISAGRAARQIVDACRHGDVELLITPAARAAVQLNAVSPATTARLMRAINRVLPTPTELAGDEARTG